VLLNECIPALVRNILNTDKGIVFICTKFDSVQDAFAYLLPSSRLNVCRVTGMCGDMFPVSLLDIVHTCVCWPLIDHDSLVTDDETFVILPLLH